MSVDSSRHYGRGGYADVGRIFNIQYKYKMQLNSTNIANIKTVRGIIIHLKYLNCLIMFYTD